MPQTPTRFFSGVSTQKPNTLYGNYGRPCPVQTYEYRNDFSGYVAADWTVAPATGTSVAQALNGGILRLTTGAVSGNGQGNALTPISFQLTPGCQMWFAVGFTIASTSVPNFIVGMTAGGANAPTSGIYFSKPTVSQVISMTINKASSTTVMTNTTTIADATYLSLGFYYDGKPTPTLYGYSSSANPSTFPAFGSPQQFGGSVFGSMGGDQTVAQPLQALTNLPAVVITPSVFIQTNAASTAIMDVDYLFAATEVIRV